MWSIRPTATNFGFLKHFQTLASLRNAIQSISSGFMGTTQPPVDPPRRGNLVTHGNVVRFSSMLHKGMFTLSAFLWRSLNCFVEHLNLWCSFYETFPMRSFKFDMHGFMILWCFFTWLVVVPDIYPRVTIGDPSTSSTCGRAVWPAAMFFFHHECTCCWPSAWPLRYSGLFLPRGDWSADKKAAHVMGASLKKSPLLKAIRSAKNNTYWRVLIKGIQL